MEDSPVKADEHILSVTNDGADELPISENIQFRELDPHSSSVHSDEGDNANAEGTAREQQPTEEHETMEGTVCTASADEQAEPSQEENETTESINFEEIQQLDVVAKLDRIEESPVLQQLEVEPRCEAVACSEVMSSSSTEVLHLRKIVTSLAERLNVNVVLPHNIDDNHIVDSIIDKFMRAIDKLQVQPSAIVSPSESAAAATASKTAAPPPVPVPLAPPVWEEYTEQHPAPDYGMDSPVIAHLLSTWTTDASKAEFLRSWVKSLYVPSYEALGYPPGLQVTNLSSVVKDGFMVLLVPLIRSLSKYPLVVHTRKHYRGQGGADEEVSGDPFAAVDAALYDVRIKRTDLTIPTGGRQPTSSSDEAASSAEQKGHSAQRSNSEDAAALRIARGSGDSDSTGASNDSANRYGNRYRVDSQEYYSPLSEINSFLPVIEAKTKRRIDGPAEPAQVPHVVSPLRRAVSRTGASDAPHAAASAPHKSDPVATTAQTPAAAPTASVLAPVVPATFLQSIYSWWDPGTALASAAPAASAPAASSSTAVHSSPKESDNISTQAAKGEQPHTDVEKKRDISDGDGGEGVRGSSFSEPSSMSSTVGGKESSAATASSVAVASPSPANKIAEKLQQIREQKLQYQQKQRDKQQRGVEGQPTQST